MTDTVFALLAEGGSITIERKRNQNGEKFIYHQNEMDLTDEGVGLNKICEYETFEQPFQIINSRYPWYRLHIEQLHNDFRDYVLTELIINLNKNGITPEDLHYSKHTLEQSLNVRLEFGIIESDFQSGKFSIPKNPGLDQFKGWSIFLTGQRR